MADVDTRRQLLKIAETLWSELQRNELGGYSGINRPFYIAEKLKDAYASGEAAERQRLLALSNEDLVRWIGDLIRERGISVK